MNLYHFYKRVHQYGNHLKYQGVLKQVAVLSPKVKFFR